MFAEEVDAVIAALVLATAQEAALSARPRWLHEILHHTRTEDFARGSSPNWNHEVDAPLAIGAFGWVTRTGIACWLDPTTHEWHGSDVVSWDSSAWYDSPVVRTARPFQRVTLSYNAESDAITGLWFRVRVGRVEDDSWSDWVTMSSWSYLESGPLYDSKCDSGSAIGGVFVSNETFDRLQYRIHAGAEDWSRSEDPSAGHFAKIHRVVVCASGIVGEPEPSPAPRARGRTRLAVPFRTWSRAGLGSCLRADLAACVAMVMEYRGRPVSQAQLAIREVEQFPEWANSAGKENGCDTLVDAVESAFTLGVPGYAGAFGDWSEVEDAIAAGQPLVISMSAQSSGRDGTPSSQIFERALVLCGFDERGDVLVNDPRAAYPALGMATLRRAVLDEVWLARGGQAIVLLPQDETR